MKVVNAILAILFLVFAAVQVNDPDPLLWVLLYTYVALVSILTLLGRGNLYYILVGAVIVGILAAMKIPSVIEWIGTENHSELFGEMYREKPYIEETREFGGLLIALISLLINWKTLPKKV